MSHYQNDIWSKQELTLGVVRMGVKILNEIRYDKWKEKYLKKQQNKLGEKS